MSEDPPERKQSQEIRKEEDVKSVFVQNVDYATTKEELEIIFQDCGKVERITILKDKMTNQPKGCAYIEFDSAKGVDNALMLSGTKLRNRLIRVQQKRTNLKGMSKKQNPTNLLTLFTQMARRGRGRGR